MSNPPYGQNPYGQNPYGQPSSQPSAGWGQPPTGAGNQPPQQPGWGQPAPWGQPQQPGPGAPPQQQGWGQTQQPGQPQRPGQPQQPGQPQHPGQPQQGGQPWGGPQGPQHQPQRPVPPSPVPEPEPRTAELVQRDIIVSTTEDLPGQNVTEILGEVIGVVTRPRDMRAQADLAVILTETRQAAVTAMVEMATAAGADAVIGLRFDGGKISDGASEVTAYGTAVKLDGAPQRASVDEGSSADEQPTDEQPAGADHENHDGENGPAENPAGQNPASDNPASDNPAGENPAGDQQQHQSSADQGEQSNPFVNF